MTMGKDYEELYRNRRFHTWMGALKRKAKKENKIVSKKELIELCEDRIKQYQYNLQHLKIHETKGLRE